MCEGKIILTGVTESDFDEYYRIRSCKSDVYWNGYNTKPNIKSFREIYIKRLASSPFEQNGDRRNFFIQFCDNENKENIGFVQLIKHLNSVEIGYTVIDKFQGLGYGTKALALAVAKAKIFKQEIILRIRDDNIPSQKIAKKNGFIPTDTFEFIKYENMNEKVKLRTYKYSDII